MDIFYFSCTKILAYPGFGEIVIFPAEMFCE